MQSDWLVVHVLWFMMQRYPQEATAKRTHWPLLDRPNFKSAEAYTQQLQTQQQTSKAVVSSRCTLCQHQILYLAKKDNFRKPIPDGLCAGHMLWRLLSLLTLVNFGGPEIDRAALSRYLSEAVFFPTALLPSNKLSWESISDDSATATMAHKGQQVSATFHFNRLGQVTHLQSKDRPR